MSNTQALVSVEQNSFLQELGLTKEQTLQLTELSEEVASLEVARGRNALRLGTALLKVRQILGNKGVGRDGSAWQRWCENFVYSKDYANRLIQVAEVFDGEKNIDGLSVRHLREIARYGDSKEDRQKLIGIVKENGLGVHETRVLVSDVNKNKLTLDDVVTNNPDLKKELDQRLRDAKKTSQERVDELQLKVGQMAEDTEKLKDEIELKAEQTEKLAARIRSDEAAKKLGEGDAERGKLEIALTQKTQEAENLKLSVGELQKKLASQQQEKERLLDGKKLYDEVSKLFAGTLAPTMFALRVQRIPDEAVRADLLKAVGAVDDWVRAMRAQLVTEVVSQ